MFVTIINDCTDANVQGRLGTRVASLFGTSPTFIGVGMNLQEKNTEDPAEYEAAGCLIDTLDAGEGEGIILVNVANRHGKGKKWPNGTPFGYFAIGKTLIVSTIDGYCLSLIKKLGLTDTIHVFDIPTVMGELVKQHVVSPPLAEQVINTQFRSFEFEPRVAKWIKDGITIPTEEYTLTAVEDIPQTIWFTDNFGNCKTTILPEEVNFTPGKTITTTVGEIPCYARLKDVPNKEPGLIIGSSGYKNNRFIELVVQGVSAKQHFNVSVGNELLLKTTYNH